MKRSLIGLLVAFSTLTASADARTFFEIQFRRIPVGETVAVESTGTLKLKLTTGRKVAFQSSCKVAARQAIFNDAEHGRDETTGTTFSSCSSAPCGKVSVKPGGEPWQGTLLPPSIVKAQTFGLEGVALQVACGSTKYGSFTGSLHGSYGDGDGDDGKDDIDNTMKLKASSGSLHAGEDSLALSGTQWFGNGKVNGISGQEE